MPHRQSEEPAEAARRLQASYRRPGSLRRAATDSQATREGGLAWTSISARAASATVVA